MNSITVEIKNKYGVDYIYPVCSKAHCFTEIAATKTLTPCVIKLVKSLGYRVIVQSNTPEEL